MICGVTDGCLIHLPCRDELCPACKRKADIVRKVQVRDYYGLTAEDVESAAYDHQPDYGRMLMMIFEELRAINRRQGE